MIYPHTLIKSIAADYSQISLYNIEFMKRYAFFAD
jgi:hypothetical protein